MAEPSGCGVCPNNGTAEPRAPSPRGSPAQPPSPGQHAPAPSESPEPSRAAPRARGALPTEDSADLLRPPGPTGSQAEDEPATLAKADAFVEAKDIRATEQQRKWHNLQNLKNLWSAGFITKTEYNERKAQLIDEMTGTTTRTSVGTTTGMSVPLVVPAIVPRGPPDFGPIPEESATKFVYDLATRSWRSSKVRVKLDPLPFGRGALRLCYHLLDLDGDGPGGASPADADAPAAGVSYVAKIAIDPRDQQDRELYLRDVETQTVARYYAQLYNEHQVPKKVAFVKAWILQLDDREGRPLCGVERFMDGEYRKHNSNYGYVSEEERNTPQAFSHFTYEASSHRLLVVDIQGVSDSYTDPQVHSIDGAGFGKGNMGRRGIEKFLQKHRCNPICRYLKLPAVNANYNVAGTLPHMAVMSYEHIQVVNIGVATATGLPPVVTAHTPLLRAQSQKKADSAFCGCCVIM